MNNTNITWKRTRLGQDLPYIVRRALEAVLVYENDRNDVIIVKHKKSREFHIRRLEKNDIDVKTLKEAKKIVEARIG